jgi:hypothetical protein
MAGGLHGTLLTAVLLVGTLISGQAAHGAEPAEPAPSLPPPAVWRPGVLVRGADGSIGLDADAKQREVRVCPLSRDKACGYAGLSAVFGSLRPGDRVVMAPGEYREAAILRVDRITIVAEDGAHLLGVAAGGKAALVIAGNDTVIEGLECSDIAVPDRNGACIRLEGRNLTLRGVHFHDSEQGILGGGGTVLIEDSTFERLGKGGRAHAIYINRGEELIIRRSRVLASKSQGHEVKSRARRTLIEDSIIASLDGKDSRLIDIPNGGNITIRRNVLQQGPGSVNNQMIGLGFEGIAFEENSAVIEDNLILIDRPRTTVLAGPQDAALRDNTIVGGKAIEGNAWYPDRPSFGLDPYPALPQGRGSGF